AVSTSLANRLKELNLPNSRNIKVIPNFIDESIFKPDFSKSKPCPPYNFISVGWPSAEKGTGILLEAFSKLDIPATLTIVGNSPQIDKFKKLADTLKIKDKIVWLGNVPRATMPSLFQSADIFVLPSQYETFGISYLEAIACGKPVIATTCGGPEDFVNSSNGLLVAVDDANDLAFAMHQMATNIHLYDSTIIRNYFLANFSSKIVVDKLDIWYHSGLNTNERTD
ncbi:MAG: glycosyltransferase, partial [Geobacteraceae bacterium]|nr:glycosyltransferase [Geobacteraceae bacterium]